jgi:hypothetical protein
MEPEDWREMTEQTTDVFDEAIQEHAQRMAVDALGSLVDELHANARRVTFAPAKESIRRAADLISEKRKEIQRDS